MRTRVRLVRPAVVGGAALLLSASVTPAAELKPETVQAFDRYPAIYAPDVQAAEIRARDGNRFQVYLRLYTKKVLTWVADTEHRVEFVAVDDTRMHVPSRSTRILEIEHPDTPQARLKPEGNDRGFAWRLNNYCSFEERAEGTLMQCESITLTAASLSCSVSSCGRS